MNPRIAGICLSLCICLLAAPSIRATEPSPFALPPEPEPAPAAAAPTSPAAEQTPPGQFPPSSPFALPQPKQPPAQASAPAPETGPDPDAAFNLPASGTATAATPPASTATPPGQQTPAMGIDGQPALPAAELLAQGTELARQGRYDEARIALENSLAKEPGNVLALNNLGLVMRKLGRIEEATRAYTAAMQSNPAYALTYKNYGILLEQNSEKRRAVDAYRKYCSLAPNAPDVQKVSQRADWLAGGL